MNNKTWDAIHRYVEACGRDPDKREEAAGALEFALAEVGAARLDHAAAVVATEMAAASPQDIAARLRQLARAERASAGMTDPSPAEKPPVRSARAWCHAPSAMDEAWHGHCETREEAIIEGREVYEGGVFYVDEARPPDAMDYMPTAAFVLEQANSNACDDCGEVAEDFPEVSDAARAELDALLRAWAEKHIRIDFYALRGRPERIPSVAEVAAGEAQDPLGARAAAPPVEAPS